jgi:hypothetical protein
MEKIILEIVSPNKVIAAIVQLTICDYKQNALSHVFHMAFGTI